MGRAWRHPRDSGAVHSALVHLFLLGWSWIREPVHGQAPTQEPWVGAIAFAAGVEYASRWQACGGNATRAQAAGVLIFASARQYAGDPQQAGLLKNTEVTEQARVSVEINSVAPGGSGLDPNTSWTDLCGSSLGPSDKGHPTDPFSGPQGPPRQCSNPRKKSAFAFWHFRT